MPVSYDHRVIFENEDELTPKLTYCQRKSIINMFLEFLARQNKSAHPEASLHSYYTSL